MQVGASIPLSIQLFDYDTAKYVRAWVRRPDGTLVSGSPVDLNQVALGLYQNFSLTLPNVEFVTAQYVVYDDSGYTQVSTSQGGSSDTFFRDAPSGGGDSSAFTCYLTGLIDACCQDSTAPADKIILGAKHVLSFQLRRGPSVIPYDLSDVAVTEVRLLKADGTVLTISSENVGSPIAITNAGGGMFTCVVSEAQSALLQPQIYAPVTVKLTLGDDSVVYCNIPNQLVVEQAAV